ncbi:hypothetical protein [Pseudomonas sp. fls2-241-R2A-110]|jgi:hypothetical protein|uniref:hypothetical protein n=1 Tax=Pseudomonas sp. fls2-241-R2A-110 TaxID=3040311 RepID=UPI00255323DE|nr:hypothetical protein [Pseudomonas sp. fls2-241-R2A-110]
MNKIKKRALDEVLPPAERDAMTIFVIENRPVLDTLRATLEYVSSGSRTSRDFLEHKNHLVGGHEQVQILMQLAVENGLQFQKGDSLSEIVFGLPGQNLKVTVRCDVEIDRALLESSLVRGD